MPPHSGSLVGNLQLIRHRENRRYATGSHVCDGLVHLTGNHPLEHHVAIRNDDPNRRVGVQPIAGLR